MYFFRSCAKKEGEEEKRTSEKEKHSLLELLTQARPYIPTVPAAAAAAVAAAPHYQLLRGAYLYGLFHGKDGCLKLIVNNYVCLKYNIWVFVRL